LLPGLFCRPCLASGDYVVQDLWDIPRSIESVCSGQTTLVFLCNLGVSTCREGAVYFDSQSDSIEASGIQAVCIFIGRPRDVRQAVLDLDLDVQAYIDEDRLFYEKVLEQKVLPALILLDGDGEVITTIYGGGESLDHNLRAVIPAAPEQAPQAQPVRTHRWRWFAVIASVAALVTLLLVIE
jgi:hypothetical protein